MLKHLRIQNIILVEEADIPFHRGLNVLTGETGSGKSAIMQGLALIMGERADTTIIRKGCEKGSVEAVFEVEHLSPLLTFLSEAGIDQEPEQELIIRREIVTNGKGRIWINHQPVQLTLLRQLGQFLLYLVGQHASQDLFSLDYHRHVVDLYGHLHDLIKSYALCFHHENTLRKQLENFMQEESKRLREIDIYQREVEELQEACLKEGEEEELFIEYSRLTHAQEIMEKIHDLNQALSGERQPLLPLLHRQKSQLDAVAHLDASLTETAQSFQNALLELQEICHTLRHYQNRIQSDPQRLTLINDRLELIHRMKRKYGATIPEITHYQLQAQERLQILMHADMKIEELRIQLQAAEEATHQQAQELSARRTEAASHLERDLSAQLQALNMPKAEFKVSITRQKRSSMGDDQIEFFLRPNIGEHQIALKEGVSGGELSRILLAMQTLLAGKGTTSTLIFDEIDANIGGQTATVVGHKLKEISQQHQVICITHFPQVAMQASHHLQISKQEHNGRTMTIVRSLDSSAKKKELERMVGGSQTHPSKASQMSLAGSLDQ